MQMYVHEMLNLFYTAKPQRKCPMLRQQSQKCACLARIARYITIICTMHQLQIFKTGTSFHRSIAMAITKTANQNARENLPPSTITIIV